MSENKQNVTGRTLSYLVLGLIAGAIICGLSAFFAGAGHGWNSAMIACFSIVGAPLAGIAWSLRGRKSGKILGSVGLVIAIIGDVFLASNTMKEGFSYVAKVWDFMPIPMVVWTVLFGGWQVIGALAVVASRKTPNQVPEPTSGLAPGRGSS